MQTRRILKPQLRPQRDVLLRQMGGGNLSKRKEEMKDLVVFIVRTYVAHFDYDRIYNIYGFIASLQNLEYRHWEAILINTDRGSLPFNPFANDERIKYSDICSSNPYNDWIAGYDVTDKVLESLRGTQYKWVIVTNGDNTYAPGFLNAITIPITTQPDLYFVNFYTRYTHPTLGTLPINMNLTTCFKAALIPRYIDLGAVIFSLLKYHNSNLTFMSFGATNSQDGYMFQRLQELKWKTKHIDQCLFSHSPNPYSCNLLGHVWYNAPNSRTESLTSCWSNSKYVWEKIFDFQNLHVIQSTGGNNIAYPSTTKIMASHKFLEIDQLKFENELELRIAMLESG
jgi:hypothetical protein